MKRLHAHADFANAPRNGMSIPFALWAHYIPILIHFVHRPVDVRYAHIPIPKWAMFKGAKKGRTVLTLLSSALHFTV